MKIVIIIILSITSLFSNLSYSASGNTGDIDIKTIRVGGGLLRVTSEVNFVDPSNCNGNGSTNSLLVLEGTPSYKEIVSFVLSAKMTNKSVQFHVSGCETNSGALFPKGLYVYIND